MPKAFQWITKYIINSGNWIKRDLQIIYDSVLGQVRTSNTSLEHLEHFASSKILKRQPNCSNGVLHIYIFKKKIYIYAFKAVLVWLLVWPLEVYDRDPMSWEANPHSGLFGEAYVSLVHWIRPGVKREVEDRCVLWICDPLVRACPESDLLVT